MNTDRALIHDLVQMADGTDRMAALRTRLAVAADRDGILDVNHRRVATGGVFCQTFGDHRLERRRGGAGVRRSAGRSRRPSR